MDTAGLTASREGDQHLIRAAGAGRLALSLASLSALLIAPTSLVGEAPNLVGSIVHGGLICGALLVGFQGVCELSTGRKIGDLPEKTRSEIVARFIPFLLAFAFMMSYACFHHSASAY